VNKRLYQQTHATWVCDHHIVWCPKYRGKVLKDKFIKQELERMFKYIANWKGFKIHVWHIGEEHIHLFLLVSPKYSIACTIQILKGRTSTWLKKKVKKFPPGPLWARGYFIFTIGANEYQIRNYIQNQFHHRVDLPRLF